MRVLFIGMGSFSEQKGGLNRYISDMKSALATRIKDYRFLFISDCQPKANEVTLSRGLVKRLVTSRRVIKNTLRDLKPDVINIHFALTAFPAIDLLSSYKIVINFQGPWHQEGLIEEAGIIGRIKCILKKSIEKIVYSKADHFIVLSKEFSDILQSTFHVSKENISIVPPIVDLEKFKIIESVRENKAKTNHFKFVAVRRLVKRTGVDLLLEAMALLKNRLIGSGITISLDIVGMGPLYERLDVMIDELELHDCVRLCGFITDEELVQKYNEANYSIMPTVALEGFGLSSIESFACGTPVIGTPSSANNEAIGEFCSSLIASEITPESLSDKLFDALSMEFSVDNCREYARSNFSAQVFSSRVYPIMESLVDQS